MHNLLLKLRRILAFFRDLTRASLIPKHAGKPDEEEAQGPIIENRKRKMLFPALAI